jgi:hypothetical protein
MTFSHQKYIILQRKDKLTNIWISTGNLSPTDLGNPNGRTNNCFVPYSYSHDNNWFPANRDFNIILNNIPPKMNSYISSQKFINSTFLNLINNSFSILSFFQRFLPIILPTFFQSFFKKFYQFFS